MQKFSVDAYVIDVLLPDLTGHDHRPSAFLVYLFLLRRACAAKRDTVSVSLQTIAVKTGLSKSTVQAAIRHLRNRGLLDAALDAGLSNPLRRVLRPWTRSTSRR